MPKSLKLTLYVLAALLAAAGVGAGRFAEQAAAKGAEVFGIDLTPVAPIPAAPRSA